MKEIGATPAERIDRLVDAVIAPGTAPGAVSSELRPMAGLIASVADALPAIPPGAAFDLRLTRQLSEAAARRRGFGPLGQRGRLLVTGAAVSGAAVGVGMTAFAVWRSSRRQPAHRFWERSR